MKLFFFLSLLIVGLCIGAGPVSAAPVKEADFLKAEEARFATADTNKNGKIDSPEEAKAAFLGSALNMSEATRLACAAAGQGVVPKYTGPNPPKTPDGKFAALSKEEFMKARRNMYATMDTNKDKSVTDEEAKDFDQRMAKTCPAGPLTGKMGKPGSMPGQPGPQGKPPAKDSGKAYYQLGK